VHTKALFLHSSEYVSSTVRGFLVDEGGATAIEYALLAMVVGIIAMAAMVTFGNAVTGKYDVITSSVDAAMSGGS